MYNTLQNRTALLQAQTDLLNSFVKHTPVAVAMVDRNMRYLLVSDRWCSYYSLDSEHMLGRSHYEITPDIPERWKQMHRRALAGETVRVEEDRWDRADGRITFSRREFVPWGSHDDGLPEGILIFLEDITARKQAEEDLRKFVMLADHSSEFVGMCDMNFQTVLCQSSWPGFSRTCGSTVRMACAADSRRACIVASLSRRISSNSFRAVISRLTVAKPIG